MSVQGLDFPVGRHFPAVAQAQAPLDTGIPYQCLQRVDSIAALHVVPCIQDGQYQQDRQRGGGDEEPRQEPQGVVC